MHLINCILQGLLTGVILSLMLGTVFFSLIKNSLSSGYKTGIYIAAGVILCDVLFISLAILSTEFAKFLENNQNTISVIGGVVLMLMGISMILRAKPKPDAGKDFQSSSKSVLYYIGNGFLLNILNPVNFFSWLAISSVLKIKFHYQISDQIIYFSACLFSIFIVEIAIAYFASLLKKRMTDKVVQRINQTSGLVFIGVGLKLILGF
jgi:L-lysine exporter family protein LysE/ArgO